MPQTPSTILTRFRHRLANHLASLIPAPCLLCGNHSKQLICPACDAQFFSSHIKRCLACALPVSATTTHCGDCLTNQPAYDSTATACDYGAPFDQLILALKFGHRIAIADALGSILSNTIQNTVDEDSLPQLCVAVPLSHERLAQRGFNQALEIAKPLAQRLNLPIYHDLLHRVRHTEAQTLLHPDQRHQNISNAFAVHPNYADKIAGKHIGVVDDVMTTGATLHEVAACLKRHGVVRVSNFVFARTPPP